MTTPHPYGTPGAPHLTVRGEAHLEAAPDLARIAVTLTARGRDGRTTLDDLTRRNTAALDLIKSYGDALEHLETGALTVTPELAAHGRGERVRAHHGTVHLTAELNDFTVLGDLATRLADLDLTRVDGPWWILRPDSPAHRQARQQAVHDAVRRARAYAEALGTTVAALIELTDTGTAIDHPEPLAGTRSMAFAAAAENAASPPPLDLEPRRQHLHAEVTARFTMRPPQL
ncbi:SIMPL domain-containing protein [Streptomyces griseoloalbus]|uniref:SIMPL domain-containing protein n=1 Tax=Streptomyces griseoloalbus TaxID=67303 RepID=A0ABV3E733_9ACTN